MRVLHCHCTLCVKTAGSGGYSINLGGDAASMKVTGSKNVTRFHALIREKALARVAPFLQEVRQPALAMG
jgi:hypothetical protein